MNYQSLIAYLNEESNTLLVRFSALTGFDWASNQKSAEGGWLGNWSALAESQGVSLDNDSKLKLYGWYKQATEGDIKAAKPWVFQVTECYKWDAHNDHRGLSSEGAMRGYIDEFVAMTRSENMAPLQQQVSFSEPAVEKGNRASMALN